MEIVALLIDHDIADHDDDAINATHLASLNAEGWGLYRMLQLNRERARSMVKELAVPQDTILKPLEAVCDRIESASKSLKWKLRARFGGRRSWYELPEEVRQPYKAE